MSKGGQAKVYFVLYLAIVVELLIIIVERDEAEEHLHKQNNETMKIVESILSQLYSGSGSEGINTKPQDEITMPAESDMAAVKEIFGGELKTWRQYQIDVGISDVTLAVKKREGESSKEYDERVEKMLSLSNVEDLEYQIFFTPVQSSDTIPFFQSDDYITKNEIDFMTFESGQSFDGPNGEPWSFVGAYKLEFDKEASYSYLDVNELHTTLDFEPIYKPVKRVGNGSAPRGMEDSAFYYSDLKTKEGAVANNNAQKRSFVVRFEPPDRNKAGIYKLRFASRTNRILGVSVLEDGRRPTSDEETKVNIGTVQLTVKDLKKVASELRRRHNELDKVPSVDDMSKIRSSADIVARMDDFNVRIEEAKNRAAESRNAADLIGKIRLYEYVVRLVTPGQSVNFDQNRSNFDINVRIQTAKPSTAKPYISMLSDNRCFSNAKHTFEIEVGPYKANNRVTGRVIGPTSADITFTTDGVPERDKKYKLVGVTSKELPAGQYVLEITHEISGKSESSRDTLYVYEAGIQDEKRASDRVGRRMSYGRRLTFDILPNSGNDISASQFKTIITFDGSTRKEVNGYRVTSDAGIECSAVYDRCAVDLVWVQPITFQQFVLFKNEYEIRLDEPSILADVNVKYTGTASKIKVEARGLSIYAPPTGLPDKDVRVQMSEPVLRDASGEVNGYSVTKQPEIVGGDADNGYIIEFELSKNSGSNVRSAEGTITIPVSVSARHPTNGKTSKSDQEIYVSISYTPSAARTPGPPGAPGGSTPPRNTPPPKQQPPPKR